MSCQICNGKNKIIEIKGDKYYFCENCQFLEKIDLLSKEDEKSRYDLHICDEDYKKYLEKVYFQIKDYIIGESLDYGCGKTHFLSDILSENNLKSDYYDYYYFPNLIENKKYNTIIMIEVIEHIKDVNSLFLNLDSLLDKGGNLIIMTNFLVANLDSWWYLRDKTHISIYNSKTFEILAQKYNYEIIYNNDKNLIVLKKK